MLSFCVLDVLSPAVVRNGAPRYRAGTLRWPVQGTLPFHGRACGERNMLKGSRWLFLFIAVCSVPPMARAGFAHCRAGHFEEFRDRWGWHRHFVCDSWYHDSCSPGEFTSNIDRTTDVLKEVSQDKSFQNTRFEQQVNQMKSESAEARLGDFYQMVGVDPQKNQEIVDFLGARDYTPYAQYLETHSGITIDQSKLVISRTTEAFKGVTRAK